jgi:hypothetical protein
LYDFLSDFDEDDMISSKDLKEVVEKLTGEQHLSEEDMQQLIDNVCDVFNPLHAGKFVVC